jgi:DNA-binding NtrC family response regulator
MRPERIRILLVDDRASERPALLHALCAQQFEVFVASSLEEIVPILLHDQPQIVLLDLGERNLEALRTIQEFNHAVPVALIGAHPDDDYASGRYESSGLRTWIQSVIEARVLPQQIAETSAPPEAIERFGGFVTAAPAMKATIQMLRRVANTSATVLITGESGTGKEVIAQAIHQTSKRKDAPFIALNCAAIPENLLEVELFGYEKGAFTGATQRKPGKFEYANKGTIFLDEIGDMPLALQAKLLRVLQSHCVERLGGHEPIVLDVRVLAATNKDLVAAIREKMFREDLYYRLNVFHVHLPPLRERKEDIPILADLFLDRLAAEYGRHDLRGFSPTAMEALINYAWPGNVRELEHVVAHAVLLADGPRVELKDFPDNLLPWPRVTVPLALDGEPLEHIVARATATLERQIITAALRRAQGKRARCAAMLGITRKTLYNKMKQLGIEWQGDGDEDSELTQLASY